MSSAPRGVELVVAAQIWQMSAQLNARRPSDHPISPATLTNMATNPRISCQHALFMLRWLDRSPESFLRPPPQDHGQSKLPEVDNSHRLRWSLKRLYTARALRLSTEDSSPHTVIISRQPNRRT